MWRGFWITTITFVTLLVSAAALLPLHASAAASGFDPGHIIDDAIFVNSNAMSVQTIQNFLNAQVPNCDTNGTQPITYYYNSSTGEIHSYPFSGGQQVTTSRAQYGQYYDAYHGTTIGAAPYVCLKSYVENPSTGANNLQNPGASISGGESAAQIIYNAAQTYSINPEVLLVTLQKEQGLITDDWPFVNEYLAAMGYSCPDDGTGCHSQYAGFSTQVISAAWQYRQYLNNPNNYNYIVGSNNIYYAPTSQCSSYSTVNIQNQATAALYDYTPYQPDSNVLNSTNAFGSSSGPGGSVSGDSCAAYGNRNFWWYFNTWFGPTLTGYFVRTNNDGKIYLLGDNNSYYYVVNANQLSAFGFGSIVNSLYYTDSSFLQNLTNAGDLPNAVRFGGGQNVYAIDGATKHYFTYDTYTSYGQPPVGDLMASMANVLTDGQQMQTVVKQSSSPDIYYVSGSQTHYIGGPAIYQSGGYSSMPSVTLTGYYLSTMAEGAPILKAGTLTKTSDTNVYGIVTSDGGNTQQNIPATAVQNLGIPVYSNTAAVLNQIQRSDPPAGQLIADSSNNLYLIDGITKFSVSPAQLQSSGLQTSDFASSATDTFLQQFTNVSNSSSVILVRANNAPQVYEVINKQLWLIPTLSDFNALGYSMSNVWVVNPGTLNSLFTDQGNILLPAGTLFRIGNAASVYLVDTNNQKRYIPNATLFYQYGYSFNNVRSVSQTAADGYSSTVDLSMFAQDQSGQDWLVDNGKRLSMSASLAGSSAWAVPTPIEVLPSQIINTLPTGATLTQFIRVGNNSLVYKVQNGQKQPLNSPSAFFNNGGTSWSGVVSVSQPVADQLPTGSTIY